MRIGILSSETSVEDIQENARLYEEILEAGHEPQIINYRETAVAVTEAGRFLYRFDDTGEANPVEIDAVIPRINEVDVLSISLGMLALDLLISNGIYSTASPAAIDLAKNKMRSQIVMDSAGIATPYSAAPTGLAVAHPRSILKLIEPDSTRPVVLKTITGTHGKGVVLGDSRRSARSIIEGFSSNNVPIIAQQFVDTPERLDAHVDIRLIVVGGQVVASMQREAKSEDDFRANLSLGGKGKSYEPTPREIEVALRASEAIGLDIAGVYILQSLRGPLLTEVNVSPGFEIEKITGTNLARAIVRMTVQKGEKRTPPGLIIDI
jgi:ribosomal protein S6--L-glutamate ligase